MGLKIAVDASRNRSGGAKAHLIGILSEAKLTQLDIEQIHVWSDGSLLDSIPDVSWIVKHNPTELNQSLVSQIWWQATKLTKEIKLANCDILFTTDASTLCSFSPMVVLSRDMLSYESGVMLRFKGYSLLRLIAILLIQNLAFRRAQGVIFLTKYAGEVIQRSCGSLKSVSYIPHGVGNSFKHTQPSTLWTDNDRQIRCLYVSNTAPYKNQRIVVQSVEILRSRGYNLVLNLIGGGSGKEQKRLDKQILTSDPNGEFVRQVGFVPHQDLPSHLANTDLFIFASSCENMPNTLVEAMAVGLPIACSNRGPMPEILSEGGIYFNPEDPQSIADAVEEIIKNPYLRRQIATRAKQRSEEFSWSRCASETWSFITETYVRNKRNIIK
ncbi:glycosyl transferase family 1 [Cylindrospermopsis raciborskii S07]|uniref:glycosyltransferase family 4 protein n=1 Tax=Cylindrospermopsis raciborskii TaxID=77022 RepID=UPI000C9DB4D1|nr:glycosyltransferase family 1 protein [Cylindrospermopsis raciborskii]PNK02974.1 glycosyl transferase family 1 [Cylindrospermopsis raciborskii S10]PNK05040.1 glycosyl transferase family 1 [Cylindrospermopsis raciborskii S14]PNK09245.1 glycosyl transferase family 1 [Cylindrospermopsis raciborskii S07]PNK13025.1 glycosyl transferase family 1 [Cylindrospermopsis raciborskii S06]PNK18205.1 glycosyl transferase family 1 [Cylindrospermopsis raciborskii S05]